MSTLLDRIPISEEDITANQWSVTLPTDKFRALIDYVEKSEDLVTFGEFDLNREREFTRVLLSALAESRDAVKHLAGYDSKIVLSFNQRWYQVVVKLFEQGVISSEQVKAFEEAISESGESVNGLGA